MPRIPEELIERVKAEVSVVSLAEQAGVELRRTGGEMVGRCPFPPHEDSTPSLSINIARNVWQCFGCVIGGSAIDWVMRERRLDFRAAAEALVSEHFPEEAARALGEPERERARTRRSRQPELPCPFDFSGDDTQLLSEYVDYCHALLLERAEAQDYAKKRGLDDPELVARFKLGYQDRTLGLRLPEAATKAGAGQRARFQALGLIRSSGHAHFVGSLVIPTIDLAGNVTGIYGRKTRDDLNKNHASPKHLYLPGPDRDVFGEEAFVTSKEIVLCEARIDALTFWRWGIRNVTACRGVNGLSEALVSAFVRHGTKRCLIAFDRDEAGDVGAVKAAEKLMAVGVECLRVQFPKGMDANEVALKMHPAGKTLDLFLRSAVWMGSGPRGGVSVAVPQLAPEVPEPAPVSPALTSEDRGSAVAGPIQATERAEPGRAQERAAEERTAAISRLGNGLVHASDDEALFAFDDRRYRVRGLARCLSYGSLTVVLKAEREGDYFAPPSPIAGWFLDKLDLVASRQRDHFEKRAAYELGVKEEVVRHDLGLVLGGLEKIQDERIRKALEPKVKVPAMTEQETSEALAFWQSPDLLGKIVADFTACGLVGEDTNKLVCYVAAVSRLLDRPLAILIQSSSAAGKTALMDALLALVPEESFEKYTAVSGKGLFYFDEETSLRHKVLAIVEEEGAEKATYPLKLLHSEGELRMASTGKDPHTGRLVTQLYRVEGPVMIILTTTAIDLDPELENRCLRLTVDESREQTRLIHELQRKRQTLEGLVAQKKKAKLRALHQNAQRLLRPLKVLNPYEPYLTFVDDQTRTRRDHDKYLTILEALALVHQHQRSIRVEEVDGEKTECVEVTLDDIAVAGRIAGDVLGRTLDELPPQTRRFLDVLHAKVTELCEGEGVACCDLLLSRKQIREMSGWRDTQVKVHLGRLVDLEYVLVHRAARGTGCAYELLYAGEGKSGERFVLGLVDVEKLRTVATTPATTASRSEVSAPRSGAGRPLVGPMSGGGRTPATRPQPALGAALCDSEAPVAEISHLEPSGGESLSDSRPGRTRKNRTSRPSLLLNLLRRPPVSLRRGPAAGKMEAEVLALVAGSSPAA